MGEPFIMSKDETLGFARGMLINCTDVQLERFYESVIHYLKNNKKDSSKADEEIFVSESRIKTACPIPRCVA